MIRTHFTARRPRFDFLDFARFSGRFIRTVGGVRSVCSSQAQASGFWVSNTQQNCERYGIQYVITSIFCTHRQQLTSHGNYYLHGSFATVTALSHTSPAPRVIEARAQVSAPSEREEINQFKVINASVINSTATFLEKAETSFYSSFLSSLLCTVGTRHGITRLHGSSVHRRAERSSGSEAPPSIRRQ